MSIKALKPSAEQIDQLKQAYVPAAGIKELSDVPPLSTLMTKKFNSLSEALEAGNMVFVDKAVSPPIVEPDPLTVAEINTGLSATYGMKVNAGGQVASLELHADKFVVWNNDGSEWTEVPAPKNQPESFISGHHWLEGRATVKSVDLVGLEHDEMIAVLAALEEDAWSWDDKTFTWTNPEPTDVATAHWDLGPIDISAESIKDIISAEMAKKIAADLDKQMLQLFFDTGAGKGDFASGGLVGDGGQSVLKYVELSPKDFENTLKAYAPKKPKKDNYAAAKDPMIQININADAMKHDHKYKVGVEELKKSLKTMNLKPLTFNGKHGHKGGY